MPQNQSQISLVSGESGGSQRAILLWENVGKIHRSYKRVTFAFVPGLKTDEQVKEFNEKPRKRSKVIKDLPMEGIQLSKGVIDEEEEDEYL